MQTIAKRLEDSLHSALLAAFGKALQEHPEHLQSELTQSTQPKFGHYQCNNAPKLAGILGKNPREVASTIASAIDAPEMIEKLEIAGPGFINITLKTSFLEKEIEEMMRDSHCGVPIASEKDKVIVEFSSPNIAKELHVGHLRSTIIGDSIARLLEFLGYDVLRLNHIGDWGTQFGMLIAYLRTFEPDFFAGKKTADLAKLMEWYRLAKQHFDADPEFKKQAQLEVVRLQGGDEASREAWQMICDISRRAFQEIYSLLDIEIEERGESFYNPMLPEVVADMEKRGLITESDRARCVFLEGFTSRDGSPLPMIVQKSDGGYNYATTDMAAVRHRIEKEGAKRIIMVTDAGQSLHFQMIAKAAEKAGYLDPEKVAYDHVPFGVVLGADGKKFKTRSGETVKLVSLIDEAIARAKAIFKERLPEASEKEIDELGTILGIDAIKYADLASHRLKDYVFSFDRMLRFEGNTAAFLLYSYVRIQGIKRKLPGELNPNAPVRLTQDAEINLALHLRRFGETLEMMARDLLPNRLCEYLYELSEKFNAFFRDCQVIGSEEEKSRLVLIEATERILGKGLQLLGLKTLPRM